MLTISDNRKLLRDFKFIDLFAGIGGFHYALKSFGAECVFASEIDEQAAVVYSENHKLRPFGDITKIHTSKIPVHDILCAGFPCQAFSISGKQKGFEDSRGTLFFDIARIIKFHNPKILLLENVKNFAKHDKGNTLKKVVEILEGLNYKVFYKVLNTSNFGLPQNRERIFFVAFSYFYFENPNFNFPSLRIKSKLEDILEANPLNGKIIERNDISIYKDFKIRQNLFGELELPNKPIQIGKVNKGGQGERIYHSKGHSVTLSASGGGIGSKTGLYKIGNKIRKLSPRECARLQGFPEDFKLPESVAQAQKQFGNSVSINTLQFIIQEILNTMEENGRETTIRLTNSKERIQERAGHCKEIQQLET
ncbi:MAG: DNA cytosine methyltransferase [Calditrichaeota bacterium]|nr:MAG: DNA cytosine methyltransferase [Calditrichota bacterium]